MPKSPEISMKGPSRAALVLNTIVDPSLVALEGDAAEHSGC